MPPLLLDDVIFSKIFRQGRDDKLNLVEDQGAVGQSVYMDAADWNEELRTRHVLNLDIMRLAESLKVDFAFPTQTVHIAEMPGQPQQLPQVPDRASLREIVNSFGPGGESGQRVDQPISSGHESVLGSPYAQADEGG